MTLYLGSGFRCRRSAGCAFRVMPSSGDDRDMNEAAAVLKAHERGCRWERIVPDKPFERTGNMDDRRTALAMVGADLGTEGLAATDVAATTRPALVPQGLRAPLAYHCRCKVCGDPFAATGPRSQFCPKPTCQAKRRSA